MPSRLDPDHDLWKSHCLEVFDTLSRCGLGAVLLDEDHTILSVNDTGAQLLHSSRPLLENKALPASLTGLLSMSDEPPFCRTAYGEYVMRQPAEPVPGLPDGFQIIVFRDASADYRCALLEEVVSRLHEGVVICDEESRLYYCNTAASRMDSIVAENELGRKIDDIYQMADGSDCPLPTVVRNRHPLLNYRQHYSTRHGKSVDAVANTWPVHRQGHVLGAFNLLEDWSTVNALHRQILDLQEKLIRTSTGIPNPEDGQTRESSALSTDNSRREQQHPVESGKISDPAVHSGKKGRAGQHKNHSPKSPLTARYTFDDIICADEQMRRVVGQCRRAARSDSSVMIYGETGTGKELFAQSIHNASPRSDGPFLAINCAALPENLLESLLFGSVKGAYTGAENRAGLFEQASHGTLLLDEINSMNVSLQAKLLRVLQEGTVRRVGGTSEIQVDVRVLSCTNVPPLQAIAEGKMRQDLFYRLGVVSINIPPLRERRADIPLLAAHFLMDCNATMQSAVCGIDEFTLEIFRVYSWPGNVRELQHAIEHAMNILPDGADLITPEYIPQNLLSEEEISAVPSVTTPAPSPDNLHGRLQDLEKQTLITILKENCGNISKAARALHMSRQNLQYRIKRYGINVDEFRRNG